MICYYNILKSPKDLINVGSETRLSTYSAKRRENPANLVTSRKIITRFARPISLVYI